MNILGLIPARGGSKGIPYKNIALLAGKPLLAYTCEAALGCGALTRVVLSTDDERIADVGREWGVDVPFMRPAGLAQDNTASLPVAQHAIRWLADNENWQTDILVLLQPTSPLRQAHHIDQALAKMHQTQADTLVSVVKVPHSHSPYTIMQEQDGRLQDFWQEPLPFDRYRRQNLPTLYARNGPAVLATRTAVLFEQASFYGDLIVPYEMTERDSVDIDTLFDLQLAAWLLGQREATA